MPLVDVALAFAITMFAVATLVTTIVHVIQQLPAWLPQFILKMAPQWFIDLVKKVLGHRAQGFEQMMNDFQNQGLANIVSQVSNDSGNLVAEAIAVLKTPIVGTSPISHLSNAEMINKLKQTDLGKTIASMGDQANDLFNQISQQYEAIEKKYTEMFREKSRLIGTIVALLLAVALNIDSVNILANYFRNPTLRTAVAAKADKATSDYKKALEEAAKVGADVQGADAKKVQADLDKAQKELKSQFDDLSSGAYPFGWSYFPYWPYPPSALIPYTGGKVVWAPTWTAYFEWFAGILLTATLAGLGSPFWYDVISQITRMARGESTTSTDNSGKGSTVTSDLAAAIADRAAAAKAAAEKAAADQAVIVQANVREPEGAAIASPADGA